MSKKEIKKISNRKLKKWAKETKILLEDIYDKGEENYDYSINDYIVDDVLDCILDNHHSKYMVCYENGKISSILEPLKGVKLGTDKIEKIYNLYWFGFLNELNEDDFLKEVEYINKKNKIIYLIKNVICEKKDSKKKFNYNKVSNSVNDNYKNYRKIDNFSFFKFFDF